MRRERGAPMEHRRWYFSILADASGRKMSIIYGEDASLSLIQKVHSGVHVIAAVGLCAMGEARAACETAEMSSEGKTRNNKKQEA